MAALVPLFRRGLNHHLQKYCSVTAIHGSLQGMLLLSGVSITSNLYAIEWHSARVVQLVFATLFTVEITKDREKKLFGPRLIAAVIVSIGFGVTPLPTNLYNWLAFGFAFCLLLLGITAIGVPAGNILASYWLAFGAYQYAFLRLSADPASIIWHLNWWLPSAISITAFLMLGVFGDHTPSRWK